MPKFKDWEPGLFRVKLEIVDDTGGQLKLYMPRLSPAVGGAFLALGVLAVTELQDREQGLGGWLDRAVRSLARAWAGRSKALEADGSRGGPCKKRP